MNICFITGHGKGASGGYDPGAVSGGCHEFKIAREIAKHAQAYYNANYTEHADLMNYEGDLYLTERIAKVNASNYDFIAEIHLNAGGGTGTECYYHKGSAIGRKYADAICDAVAAALGVPQRPNGTDDGGDKIKLNSAGKDYFAIIRETKPTAVLVETVFIDNSADLDKLKTAEGQRKCGEAIAKAVAQVRGAKRREAALPQKPTESAQPAAVPFLVKITCTALNVRAGAGMDCRIKSVVHKNEVYTIVETKQVGSATWGRLKSGAGWINIGGKYCKKL